MRQRVAGVPPVVATAVASLQKFMCIVINVKWYELSRFPCLHFVFIVQLYCNGEIA